jgi:radical SAM protein with 4Fe4S-binding SPASM domain
LTRKQLKEVALDSYYYLARTTGGRHVHNQLRRWSHRWRYGVDSTFMFRSVELEVNSMCNRRCSYCPNVSTQRPTGYMTESLFQKIIGDLAEMDFDGNVSYHFYGEPMLDRRLLGFVEYTVRHLPRCRPLIYSNGDFLTLDIFREYVKWGRTTFCITQHDNRMPPTLQAILSEASAEEQGHIEVRFANEIQMMNRSGLIKTMDVPREPLEIPCDAPLATMVITMNGNVVLCCNDYLETQVIGNVRTYSLQQVWCSEPFERFRSALSNGDRTASKLCVSCDAIPSESQLRRIVAN